MTGTRRTIQITWFDESKGRYGDQGERVYDVTSLPRATGFARYLATQASVTEVAIRHPEGEVRFTREAAGCTWQQGARVDRV